MKIIKILQQSIIALLRNKGRSSLTILGIIIGIGSVIALISLGNGVQQSISGRISSLGTTTLNIQPGASFLSNRTPSAAQSRTNGGPGGGAAQLAPSASTLTFADVASLRDKTKDPKVDKVSGNISSSQIFSNGSVEKRYTVAGIDTDFFSIQNLNIDKGNLFSNSDVSSKAKVMVLGSNFASDIFPNTNPIGKTLTIGTDTYKVLGVLATHAESGFANYNSEVFVPNQSLSTTLDTPNLTGITIKVKTENDVDQAKNDIQGILLKNHKINEAKLADFSIISAKDLLSTVLQITGVLTSFLAGIAAISLLVGGIGIMNIMLVSVTERTREIGLRKAVGAKTSDILIQFIIESMLLTLIGGLIGIGLGILAADLLGRFITITPDVTTSAIMLAVGVSTAVGLVFGIYPAALAARLNPIDALRYE